MHGTRESTRQLVRMRGRSYVAFVFSPVVPIQGWLEEIDATLARSPGSRDRKSLRAGGSCDRAHCASRRAPTVPARPE